jgi:hypothetical protein
MNRVSFMPTEAETIAAEKMRRKRFVAILGKCEDCGLPVIAGQELVRLANGIRHALCFYDPAYAKRVRELKMNTEQ